MFQDDSSERFALYTRQQTTEWGHVVVIKLGLTGSCSMQVNGILISEVFHTIFASQLTAMIKTLYNMLL